MSDIRTRPSVGKRRGNQTQNFVEIREWTQSHTSKTDWRLSEDSECQKRLKNIDEFGVAYVRNVKHWFQSYSPVKERNNLITQNFNTGRLVTPPPPKKKKPALVTAVEKYIGPKTVHIVQKNVKTAINSDIRAHSVETEK